MATNDTVVRAVKHILTAYPKERAKLGQDEIKSMFEIWPQYLSDLDETLLMAAVQEHVTHSQWLPSIAEIRQAAVSLMRQASPAGQSAIDAWGDVKQAIARVGSYNVPSFDNPITANVVKRMGWREICLSEDPEGVIRAQFERYYNEQIGRAERSAAQSPAVQAFVASIAADRFAELPAPRAADVIADVAGRLASPERDMRIEFEELGY